MVPEPLEIPGMNSYCPPKQIKSGLVLLPFKSNVLSRLQGVLSIPGWARIQEKLLFKELLIQRCGGVVWDSLMGIATEGEASLERLCVLQQQLTCS